MAKQSITLMQLLEMIDEAIGCDLADHLRDRVDAGDTDVDDADDLEVRLAIQPNYPFEHGIKRYEGVILEEPSDDEDEGDDDEKQKPILYIAESEQIGYLPGAVSKAFGWR